MKKLAVTLLAAILFVSALGIPTALGASTASSSAVSISFSGEQSVEAGKSYDYTYTISMKNACQYFIGIKADNAQISGKYEPSYYNEPFANSSEEVTGQCKITVNNDAQPGDKINIIASGSYCYVGENGVPAPGPKINSTYTLTVAADEQPTPTPTPDPTPVPTAAPEPPPIPTLTPMPAPSATPEPAPRQTEKPLKSASAASAALTPSASPSVLPSPSSNEAPSESALPSSTAPADGWEAFGIELDNLPQGGTISLTMAAANAIPVSTLKALKAKQAMLVINLGAYSCTIDGTKLGNLSEDLNAASLEMSMVKDTAVSDAADGRDIYQLSFTQEGEMPGRFTYRFAAAENHPGDTLYLYCYHELSGLTEYKQSAAVDQDGHIAFDIYEGNCYFVTASHTEIIDEEPGVALAAVVPINMQGTSGPAYWPIILVVLLLFAFVGFMRLRRVGFFKNRRDYRIKE